MPKDYQLKIKKLVKRLETNPFALDIKKLSSNYKATHRVRLGSYRLILDIDLKFKRIFIADILRRTTYTYR